MAAYGLYTHIQSNKRRSIALLIGLFLLVYLLVYAGALTGEALTKDAPLDVLMRAALRDALYAAPWATLGTALWILIAYKFHQSMIDAVTGGREVTRQEEPRLYNLLENLCISRGITMPKLKVIEDGSLNAFATGMNEKQYSITVTSGLINSLDDAEIESVLGHELTHIRNGDVRMLVIAVIIAGVIAFFAELVFRLMFQGGLSWRSNRSSGDRKGAGVAILIAVALIAVAWILSIVIRFALSRQREYLADSGSVELTKNPDAMISALRKIERYKIKTRSDDTPIGELSGGNVQRTVLARELGGEVDVMIAANPCFGLDFAAVAQIHAEIMAARNRGAAVLLVSEDLDELLEGV